MLWPCCGLPHYGQRRCYAFLDVYLERHSQRQAVAPGLVAIGVIGEGGVDDAAGDRRHRMREGLAGLGIGVTADIRFDQDVGRDLDQLRFSTDMNESTRPYSPRGGKSHP